MDALWNLEDKWKISTQKAAVLLVCTAVLVFLAFSTVIVMILRKKGHQRNRIASHDSDNESESSSLIMYEGRNSCNKCTYFVKNVIVGSACWSMPHKWRNDEVLVKYKCWSLWKERNHVKSNCMKFCGCLRSKLPPVWQRPILMGERCEFPKFSGLILYDERGRPLPPCDHDDHQEQFANNSTSHNQVGQLMELYHHGLHEIVETGGSTTTTTTATTMLKDLL